MLTATASNTVSVNPINYGSTPQNATVSITNSEGTTVNYTASLPTGWTAFNGTGCVATTATSVSCINVTSISTVTFLAQNPASVTSHNLSTITLTTTSGGITSPQLLRVDNAEIFYTLVEYGRGDGDYMYSSKGNFKSENGYPYLPENTSYELNFLHKIFNIRQYFGQQYAATRATFSCTYPGDSLIRTHLDSSTILTGNWTVNYSIDEIPLSWERMGYAGIQFSARTNSTTIDVSCKNVQYTLDSGIVSVPTDSLTLQVTTLQPLSITSSSTPTNIFEGDSEVIVTYTITNIAPYVVQDPLIQIGAPTRALFIGVRGELWGTGQTKYTQELTELQPGETYSVSLLARFNTTGLASQNLALSSGIQAEFVPPWQANSYNPKTVTEYIVVPQNISYTSGTPASINSVQRQIDHIYVQVDSINDTVNRINNTANLIWSLEQAINTTFEAKLDYINNSITTINSTVNGITNTVNQINTTVNNLNTAAILAYLATINSTTTQSLQEINNTFIQIEQNTTAILKSIRSFRDFQEEAIFLVTDSQSYGRVAQSDFQSGDLQNSAVNLQKSAGSLQQAQKVMSAQEDQVYAENLNILQKIWRWITQIF
jgi:hypothetical protein